MMRTEVNKICGNEKTQSVAPIMELLFENAKKNNACLSKHANRQDTTVKKFASSLFCLIGKVATNFFLQILAVLSIHGIHSANGGKSQKDQRRGVSV